MQHLTSLSALKYVIALGSGETRKIRDLCQGEGSSRPFQWMPAPGKHAAHTGAPRNMCLVLLDATSKMKYSCTGHNSSSVPHLSQILYMKGSPGHRAVGTGIRQLPVIALQNAMHRRENKPSPLTPNGGEGTVPQWFPSTGAGLSPVPEWHISLAHRMLQGSWHRVTHLEISPGWTWVIPDQGAARGLTEALY